MSAALQNMVDTAGADPAAAVGAVLMQARLKYAFAAGHFAGVYLPGPVTFRAISQTLRKAHHLMEEVSVNSTYAGRSVAVKHCEGRNYPLYVLRHALTYYDTSIP